MQAVFILFVALAGCADQAPVFDRYDQQTLLLAQAIEQGPLDLDKRIKQQIESFSQVLRILQGEPGQQFLSEWVQAPDDQKEQKFVELSEFVAQRTGVPQASYWQIPYNSFSSKRSIGIGRLRRFLQQEGGYQALSALVGGGEKEAKHALEVFQPQAADEAFELSSCEYDVMRNILFDPHQLVFDLLEDPWFDLPEPFGAIGGPDKPSSGQLLQAIFATDHPVFFYSEDVPTLEQVRDAPVLEQVRDAPVHIKRLAFQALVAAYATTKRTDLRKLEEIVGMDMPLR